MIISFVVLAVVLFVWLPDAANRKFHKADRGGYRSKPPRNREQQSGCAYTKASLLNAKWDKGPSGSSSRVYNIEQGLDTFLHSARACLHCP